MAGERTPNSSGQTDQYRLLAVEPHGWSSVLVEDRQGAIFIVATAVRSLRRITAEQAELAIAQRTYRLWRGSREWAPLDALPLIAPAFSGEAPPPLDESAH